MKKCPGGPSKEDALAGGFFRSDLTDKYERERDADGQISKMEGGGD